MSDDMPTVPPILSTPDARIFEESHLQNQASHTSRLTDEQVIVQYEIKKTVDEIRAGRWKRIALQFPDAMLVDSPRVFQALSRGLKECHKKPTRQSTLCEERAAADGNIQKENLPIFDGRQDESDEKLFILADTSYGACCVDEVAAEHANAEVVVHYGRSCLSPTARLPVIYVFTKPPLDIEALLSTFRETYPNIEEKIVLMADIPYQYHLLPISQRLLADGYNNIAMTSVVHDVASPLPNRTLPLDVVEDASALLEYSLFHVAEPPSSLLLTVASRVKAIKIYTNPTTGSEITTPPTPVATTPTAALLRRRYALLLRLTTAPVIGILINTLSVKSYMHMLAHLKSVISAAGKKSYTFVVGKVNAAKVANFAEVEGWVVVGCWESSLFDNSDFWKPIVTPWELEFALRHDKDRIWDGEWRADFEAVLQHQQKRDAGGNHSMESEELASMDENHHSGHESDDESAPPEFDLRTGRYVSNSRPMASVQVQSSKPDGSTSDMLKTLIPRAKADLATVGGAASPAAEYFKNKRSWQGLGSDYGIEYDEEGRQRPHDVALIEVGRSGIARGYIVGDEVARR